MADSRIDVLLKGRASTLMVPDNLRHLPLSTLLRRAGMALNTRCGERGLCDGCLVQPTAGTLLSTQSGGLVDARWAGQVRACQHLLDGTPELQIDIPDRSLLQHKASIVTEFAKPHLQGFDPIWRADSDYVGGKWNGRGNAARPIARPLGVAIDIGTTTVVVLLIDLCDGSILARTADFNQQLRLGDDVVTRITRCFDPAMLDEMQRAIVEETILPLILAAAETAGVNPGDIVCGTVAGNTTMLHLMVGVDPTPLGIVPFKPSFLEHRIVCGDLLSPWKRTSGVTPVLHLLPGCSAYIGSDLSGGMIASQLCTAAPPGILLDIGTNGEMILNLGDRLIGCATAAGPAFEGAGLTCGTRAADGAITHVSMNPGTLEPSLKQIGEGDPIGLCGSFYVDFLAEARRIGLLDPGGRYGKETMARFPDRFVKTQCAGHAFRVGKSANGEPLIVSEGDIAKLLTAKAAIAAGLQTLLAQAKTSSAAVNRLFLAGGFGLHLDVVNAIQIGMLPGFVPTQVEVIGNSSLAGAWMCLCSTAALDATINAVSKVSVIELNHDPEFEDRFVEMLSLP